MANYPRLKGSSKAQKPFNAEVTVKANTDTGRTEVMGSHPPDPISDITVLLMGISMLIDYIGKNGIKPREEVMEYVITALRGEEIKPEIFGADGEKIN